MQKRIYISYNPNSHREEELAFDLYKTGRKNGFMVNLPHRPVNSNNLTQQTKLNIDTSDWFLIFSIEQLSETVRQEIEYALGKGKTMNQIIVVYSSHEGRNIPFKEDKKPIEMFVDDYDINQIEEFKQAVLDEITRRNEGESNNNNNGLKAILGIGAAILLLREILRTND